MDTEEMMTKLEKVTAAAKQKREEYRDANYVRDNAIREAIKAGISMYSIGKRVGISHSAIIAIRDK